MKMKTHRRDPRRGSALLAAMIVIVILTFAAAGILSYSLTTYRNSVRQAMLDQGKEIADSEMEYMYYTWKGWLLRKYGAATVQSHMSSILGTGLSPQAAAFNPPLNMQGWTVSRSISFGASGTGIPGTTDGGATGIIPGTNSIGRNYYFDAETSATVSLPLLGNVTYKAGRHFVYSSTSLFQYAVFYEGNLEMAAGGNMTIGGPIATNASAFLGSKVQSNGTPYTLTLTDTIYYFQDYNGAVDPTSGETDYLLPVENMTTQEASATQPVDPIYNPNPQAAAPVNQVQQRALQVNHLSNQSSFIGGVDVAADVNNPAYAAAYTNPTSGVVDPNEIYRAVIAPPPQTGGVDDAEDPTVAGSRMYNNAALLITITQNATGTPTTGSGGNTTIHVGIAPDATNPSNPANLSMYDNNPAFSTIVNPTGLSTDVIRGVRQTIVDPREATNGTSGVNLTTVDIGNLNTALHSAMSNSAFQAAYNGVVYIYDNTDNTQAQPTNNASYAHNLTNSLNGIVITDGTTTPAFNDNNGNPIGFTVVSNNGVYVQGDYNVNPITLGDGSSVNNPTAIMGDAVTAISQAFSVAANAYPANNPLTNDTTGLREAQASTAVAPNGPYNPGTTGPATPNGMTITSAILTGNTPTNVALNSDGSVNFAASVSSGGSQNLVRMIEDWYYNPFGASGTGGVNGQAPLSLVLNGSLGQLFTSQYFTGNYANSGVGGNVYEQPINRVFNYDLGFKNRTPAGSPSTTAFTRGDFFFW
jgi:hypothetical protein